LGAGFFTGARRVEGTFPVAAARGADPRPDFADLGWVEVAFAAASLTGAAFDSGTV